MTAPLTYLLSISIGPVQEFIASARKTADLKAGSDLLVAVVRVVVKCLEKQGGEFIFPANTESNGANKILLQVKGKPAELAAEAKKAALTHLRTKFTDVVGDLEGSIEIDIAEKQLDHFLEFYAAWVPRTDNYAADRKRVEKLLAGRKALRDFEGYTHGEGVPKSPLDPALACIFTLKEGGIPDKLKERFTLKDTEYLDAISLLKREHGRSDKRATRTNELAQRATMPAFTSKDEEYTPTYPYFAILVADGDSMGKKLSELEKKEGEAGLEAHREFSRRLDDFARDAAKAVIEHDGFPVYTGGDDVLALLPVTQALACANKLRQDFAKATTPKEDAQATGCTLSAGIAIVHYREPLSTSLARARDAEKKAKAVDGKNAVCVALHTRGGAPLVVSEKWDNVDQLVKWLAQSVAGEIPRGLPYELQALAREWPNDLAPDVLRAEAQRIADRKRKQDGLQAEVEIPELNTKKELEQLAQQMILARFLSGKGDRP